jgi:hypothetical protein
LTSSGRPEGLVDAHTAQDERPSKADSVADLEQIGDALCDIKVRAADIHNTGDRRVQRQHLGAHKRIFAAVAELEQFLSAADTADVRSKLAESGLEGRHAIVWVGSSRAPISWWLFGGDRFTIPTRPPSPPLR